MLDKLFLCVGAQKSGTTWLYAQLEHHPAMAFADVKEVHYFNTLHNGSILLSNRKVEHLKRLIDNNADALARYLTDRAQGRPGDAGIHNLLSPVDDGWYIRLFGQADGRYAADFSPEYALLPTEGFEHIKRVSRQQKLLFIMRDPVARAMSAIQYFFQTKGEAATPERVWQLARTDFIVNQSRYEQTIARLREVFAPDQLMFLFFEQVMQDKQAAIDAICDFLGITRMPLVEERAAERVNASARIAFPEGVEQALYEQLGSTYAYMYQHFDPLPSSWRRP